MRNFTVVLILLILALSTSAQTKFRIHDTNSDVTGYKIMDFNLGGANTTGVTNAVASGTDIQVTKTGGGSALAWISYPFTTSATISGTVTFNVYGGESANSVNAAFRGRLFKYSGGAEGAAFANCQMTTELTTTTTTVHNWTCTPTSTAFAVGDRLVMKLFLENCVTSGCPTGTMGSGTVTAGYEGPTDGSNAASWVQINETVQTGATAGSGVPFVFNWVSGSNTNPGGTGFNASNYNWIGPASQSNNCISTFLEYGTNASISTSFSDDKSNTYSLSASGNTANQTLKAYTGKQTTAGATTPKVTFTGATASFMDGVKVEYGNHDGSCTVDVTGHSSGSTTFPTCGSMTTTADNDLIMMFAEDESTGGPITSWAASDPWRFAGGPDKLNAHALAYMVQSKAGVINPTLQMTGGGNWQSLCVAFKAGTTGTAAPSTMRVNGIMHQQIQTQTGTFTIQWATEGNCLDMALVTTPGNETSVSDNVDGSWTQGVAPFGHGTGNPSGLVSTYHLNNATADVLRTITIVWTGTQNGSTALLFDLANAKTPTCYDASDTASGNQTSAGNLSTVTSTPTASGLLINVTGINSDSLTGTSGDFNFASIFYGGEGNPSPVDQNNGWSWYRNTDTTSRTVTYTNNSAGGVADWASATDRFLAPAVAPSTVPIRHKTAVF